MTRLAAGPQYNVVGPFLEKMFEKCDFEPFVTLNNIIIAKRVSGFENPFSLKASSQIWFRTPIEGGSKVYLRVRKLGFRLELLANYISNPHAMGFGIPFWLKASLKLHSRSGFDIVFSLRASCKLHFEPPCNGVRKCFFA